MRNFSGFLTTIFLVSIMLSCSDKYSRDKAESFVYVEGKHLMYDGKPYYFVGTNFWYGIYLGSSGETGDRDRLVRELDFLKANGITNLRVLAASELSPMEKSLKPVVHSAPGDYNDELLEGLDFLLAEMGKRNMHAVVFLNNYWEWSGGMAVYNKWFGNRDMPDLSKPNADWHAFMNFSASFYRNKEANDYFKQFIESIITRKNKFTGKYYYNDPAIMSWQLANEPRPGQGKEADTYIQNYYNWIDSTAGYIHSLDTNHLVSTGSEGSVGSNDSQDYYLNAHSSSNIDYVTFHLWAKNWGWFKADDMEGSYPGSEKKAVDYINLHIDLADSLNKPVTLEEFGLGRDYEECSPSEPATYRDKYFSKVFETVYKRAAKGDVIAGTNFWTWGGEGRSPNTDYWWIKGDPFTGDPPGEPQGLNSVFNTDSTTLKVIKNHSEKMHGLREKK